MTVFVQSPAEAKVPGTVWLFCAQLLFFLMLAFPTMDRFAYPKQALVLLLLGAVLFATSAGLKLHQKTVLWTLAMAGVSLIFVIRGLFLSAPGALSDMRLYVFWPLLYLLLLSGINMRVLRGLEKTMVFSTAFIAIFVLIYYLALLKLIPSLHLDGIFSADELKSSKAAIGVSEGHVEMGLPQIGVLDFLVPFVIAAIICRRSETTWVSRKWLVLNFVFILPIVILSGRRALQLGTICAPFFTLMYGLLQPREERRQLAKAMGAMMLAVLVLTLILVPVLSATSDIEFKGLKDRFTAGFDFSASNRSDSAVGRVDQYLALMDGWKQAPYLGKGLGASAHKSIRDEKGVWGYELSYVDLLFETGIFGLLAYAAGMFWLFWSAIKIVREGGAGAKLMIPMLVGLTVYLISNATNPKLNFFDSLWTLFFPLAVINYWLLAHERNSLNSFATAA